MIRQNKNWVIVSTASLEFAFRYKSHEWRSVVTEDVLAWQLSLHEFAKCSKAFTGLPGEKLRCTPSLRLPEPHSPLLVGIYTRMPLKRVIPTPTRHFVNSEQINILIETDRASVMSLRVCLFLSAASSPEWYETMSPESGGGGGLVGRNSAQDSLPQCCCLRCYALAGHAEPFLGKWVSWARSQTLRIFEKWCDFLR